MFQFLLSRNAGYQGMETTQISVGQAVSGQVNVGLHAKWKEPESVQELIAGVKNMTLVVHMVRPWSFECLAFER